MQQVSISLLAPYKEIQSVYEFLVILLSLFFIANRYHNGFSLLFAHEVALNDHPIVSGLEGCPGRSLVLCQTKAFTEKCSSGPKSVVLWNHDMCFGTIL